MDEGLIVFIALIIAVVFMWLFYMWGAAIAEGKGRSRALGWWAAFFGIWAIVVLALLPRLVDTASYVPHRPKQQPNVAGQIERLAALRDRGALTEEEFEVRKRAVLEGR